jgi:hypothetical protein
MGGDKRDYAAGVLYDSVRSHHYLLEQAVIENACAKIVGDPFDDNEVLGLARNVVLTIKALPKESQQRFEDQRQYALDMIEVFKPAPRSCYTTSGKGNKNFVLF